MFDCKTRLPFLSLLDSAALTNGQDTGLIRFHPISVRGELFPSQPGDRRIFNASAWKHRLEGSGAGDIVSAAALRQHDRSGLLIGLNNGLGQTVVLGVVKHVNHDARALIMKTPVKDASAIRILQLRSLRRNESCRN